MKIVILFLLGTLCMKRRPKEFSSQSIYDQIEMLVSDASAVLFTGAPPKNPEARFDRDSFEKTKSGKEQHRMLCDLLAGFEAAIDQRGSGFVLAVLPESELIFYKVNRALAVEILSLRPENFFYAIFSQTPTDLKTQCEMNFFLIRNLRLLREPLAHDLVKLYFVIIARSEDFCLHLPLEVLNSLPEETKYLVICVQLVDLYRKREVVKALTLCLDSKILQPPKKHLDDESREIVERLCSIVKSEGFSIENCANAVQDGTLDPEKCSNFVHQKLPVELFSEILQVNDASMCIKVLLDLGANYTLLSLLEFLSTLREKTPTRYKEYAGEKEHLLADMENLSPEVRPIFAVAEITTGDYKCFSSFKIPLEMESKIIRRCSVFENYLDSREKEKFFTNCELFKKIHPICYHLSVTGKVPSIPFREEIPLSVLRFAFLLLQKHNSQALNELLIFFVIEASLYSGLEIVPKNGKKLDNTALPAKRINHVLSQYKAGLNKPNEPVTKESSLSYTSYSGKNVDVKEMVKYECSICLDLVFTSHICRQTSKTPTPHMFHASCIAGWMNIQTDCPLCREQFE